MTVTTPSPGQIHRWLAEQIRLRGIIWNIDNPKVLGTLWWYSASVWLVNPLLASLVATGTALSARLDDIVLHRLPSSRFTGSHSRAYTYLFAGRDGSQRRHDLESVRLH